MPNTCTNEQLCQMEGLYDELNLDDLQLRLIAAVGDYWADDVNTAIASLDFAIRETIGEMQQVVCE